AHRWSPFSEGSCHRDPYSLVRIPQSAGSLLGQRGNRYPAVERSLSEGGGVDTVAVPTGAADRRQHVADETARDLPTGGAVQPESREAFHRNRFAPANSRPVHQWQNHDARVAGVEGRVGVAGIGREGGAVQPRVSVAVDRLLGGTVHVPGFAQDL